MSRVQKSDYIKFLAQKVAHVREEAPLSIKAYKHLKFVRNFLQQPPLELVLVKNITF